MTDGIWSLQPIRREELAQPVLDVAPLLLNTVLRHGDVAVRLTEVEAYGGENDPGSHAYRGPTPRTQVMFGKAGHLYVYFTYGMHHCMNIVCASEGKASAVLFRAGEVIEGADVVAERRAGVAPRDWARGPARLTRTLAIDRAFCGMDLCDPASPVTLHRVPLTTGTSSSVRSGPRVGVSGEGGDARRYPWRFWLENEPTVSSYRPGRA